MFLAANSNFGPYTVSAGKRRKSMANLSVGKAGALKHNSGNLSDNRKKGVEAGRKASRH